MLGTNKMIPILVATLLALAAVVISLNSRSPETPGAVQGQAQRPGEPQPPQGLQDPTADTTEETIRTLSERYNLTRADLRNTKSSMDEMRGKLETLTSEAATKDSTLGQLQTTLSNLEARLEQALRKPTVEPTPAETETTTSYDVSATDLGFHEDTFNTTVTMPTGYQSASGDYLRVVPLYYQPPPAQAESENLPGELFPDLPVSGNDSSSSKVDPEAVPFATIPPGATLWRATAMTALIGRVSIGGGVVDPMPVKIIVGRENLAANGHRIDGLAGTIFTGQAIGDWNLSCVRVNLQAASFVFDSGEIVSLGSIAKRGDANDSDELLGWVSDTQGNPCIAGDRLTDAPKRIGALSLLGLASGAADAYAQSQVTSVVEQGSQTSSVTGSNTDFVLGRTAASGIDSMVQDVQTRMRDSFDAVYAPAGVEVAVHIASELRLDHHPDNRHLNYYPGDTRVQTTFD